MNYGAQKKKKRKKKPKKKKKTTVRVRQNNIDCDAREEKFKKKTTKQQ